MSAIPSPALALTSAFGRLERSSAHVLDASMNRNDGHLAAALADQVEAKAQVRASVALVRFADEMYNALLDIGRERR
ncbi:MAG: hypothetical protein AB7P07_10985 [Hyphomonadaceae bacterium]